MEFFIEVHGNDYILLNQVKNVVCTSICRTVSFFGTDKIIVESVKKDIKIEIMQIAGIKKILGNLPLIGELVQSPYWILYFFMEK